MEEVIAGVDIGGTSTKFGLVTKNGQLVVKNEIRTDSQLSYEDFFAQLYQELIGLVEQADVKVKLAGIGVGAPNGNSLTGVIDDASNLLWQGEIPVVEMLTSISGLPVSLSNDANAAAIGELLFGAARGLHDFVVITIGTGLGSGIIANGELLLGKDGHAGELGHTTVYYDGRKCSCGRIGCLETYVSAKGLVTTVNEFIKRDYPDSKLAGLNESEINSKKVTEAALNGDEASLMAFDYTGKILGMKLADTTAHLNPEAYIISGGLANAGELLFDPTRKYLEEHLLGVYKGKVKVIPSQISEINSAILGTAAQLWNQLKPSGINLSNDSGHFNMN
jgi:glucokinase